MGAWSVGMPGRPWCWAIVIRAMNWRVSFVVISDPLSDQATRIGPSLSCSTGRPFEPSKPWSSSAQANKGCA